MSVVKPEAMKLKPKPSNAPDPIDIPTSGSVGGRKGKGTQYE
jgi:hypothetical protein